MASDEQAVDGISPALQAAGKGSISCVNTRVNASSSTAVADGGEPKGIRTVVGRRRCGRAIGIGDGRRPGRSAAGRSIVRRPGIDVRRQAVMPAQRRGGCKSSSIASLIPITVLETAGDALQLGQGIDAVRVGPVCRPERVWQQ